MFRSFLSVDKKQYYKRKWDHMRKIGRFRIVIKYSLGLIDPFFKVHNYIIKMYFFLCLNVISCFIVHSPCLFFFF